MHLLNLINSFCQEFNDFFLILFSITEPCGGLFKTREAVTKTLLLLLVMIVRVLVKTSVFTLKGRNWQLCFAANPNMSNWIVNSYYDCTFIGNIDALDPFQAAHKELQILMCS